MPEPVRLQLSRKKGFSLQAHSRSINGLEAISVARPNKDGNHFVIGIDGDRETCVRLYRNDMERWRTEDAQAFDLMRNRLRGKNLACWCGVWDGNGERIPCHADILLEFVNA